MKISLNRIFLPICGVLSIISVGCYEPEEGCLDANARNFALDADQPCTDDCCEYPTLQIDFQHKAFVDGAIQNINLGDSIYMDGFGNPFQIKSIQYYLSDLHLVREDGAEVGVEDELTFDSADGATISVADNVVLVNPETFGTQTIGTFNNPSSFTAIRFTLGLNALLNEADTLDFSIDHPLGPQENNMYLSQEEGYIFNKIELILNPTVDTVSQLIILSGQESLINLEFPANFSLDKGFNLKLLLLVDYLTWFEDVNLLSEEEIIQQRIVNNLAKSFSLVEIEFN